MRTSSLLILVIAICGCTGEASDTCEPRVPADVDPAGTLHQYVVDTIEIPSSASEAGQLGLNLTENSTGRPDNSLGQVLSIIAQMGDYDLGAEARALITSGEILHLLEIQATSLTNAGEVGVRVLHADDTDADPSDNFTGTEAFAIDTSRGTGSLTGDISDGYVVVNVGTVPLAVTLPGLDEAYVVRLYGARIEATIGPDGLSGRIGGAISKTDVDTKLIPVLADGLGRIVQRDCTDTVCDETSFGGKLLDYFDADLDGAISVSELRDSSLTRSLLAPDVDLLDDAGNLAPRCDGIKEGVSIGVGFTAVPATF